MHQIIKTTDVSYQVVVEVEVEESGGEGRKFFNFCDAILT
jgi:hypothetical protein